MLFVTCISRDSVAVVYAYAYSGSSEVHHVVVMHVVHVICLTFIDRKDGIWRQ